MVIALSVRSAATPGRTRFVVLVNSGTNAGNRNNVASYSLILASTLEFASNKRKEKRMNSNR